MPNRHTLGQQKLARRRGTKMTAECSRRATRGVRESGWWLRGRQREAAGGERTRVGITLSLPVCVLSSTNPSATTAKNVTSTCHLPLPQHLLVPSHSTLLTQNLVAAKRQEDDRAGRRWTRESRGRVDAGAGGGSARAGGGRGYKNTRC